MSDSNSSTTLMPHDPPVSLITEKSQIWEAKQQMRKELDKGGTCPCCGQHFQMYKRPITSAMAYGLILFHNHTGEQWTHMEEFFKSFTIPCSIRGDFPKLRYWDLIRQQDGSREDENPENGMYQITAKGTLFVLNKMSLPSHVNIYNNKAYGFSEKRITILEALKKKFDYSKLMKGEL
jgi:hypothetical protein